MRPAIATGLGLGLPASLFALSCLGPFQPQLLSTTLPFERMLWSASLNLDALFRDTTRGGTVAGQIGMLRLMDDEGRSVLQCPTLAGEDLETAWLQYAEGVEELDGCLVGQNAETIQIFEVNGRSPAVCPGSHTGSTELAVHQALYRPLLAPDPYSTDDLSTYSVLVHPTPGLLCTNEEGKFVPDLSNCLNGSTTAIYCGDIAADAVFPPGHGEKPIGVRPADVAASAIYFRALARTPGKPSEITPLECSERTAATYAYGSIDEVLIKETVDEYLRSAGSNGKRELDQTTVAFLQDQFKTNDSGLRLCVVLRTAGASNMTFGAVGQSPNGPDEVGDEGNAGSSTQLDPFFVPMGMPVINPRDVREPDRLNPIYSKLRAYIDGLARGAPGDGRDWARRAQIALNMAFTQEGSQTALRLAIDSTRINLSERSSGAGPWIVHSAGSSELRLNARDTRWATAPAAIIRPVRDELLEGVAETCREANCVVTGLWSAERVGALGWNGKSMQDEDANPTMIALFARRGGNKPCIRALAKSVLEANTANLQNLALSVQTPLGGQGNVPSSGRSDRVVPGGLLPSDLRPNASESIAPIPLQNSMECNATLEIRYLSEEPWRPVVELLGVIAEQSGIKVNILPLPAKAIRPSEGNSSDAAGQTTWDLVLTAVPAYTHPLVSTLKPLLVAGGASNRSMGASLDPDNTDPSDVARCVDEILEAYERKVVRGENPIPVNKDQRCSSFSKSESRAVALRQVEEALLNHGLPIIVLDYQPPMRVNLGRGSLKLVTAQDNVESLPAGTTGAGL